MSTVVWVLISLNCGHLNGCDFDVQTFETRDKCHIAMFMPSDRLNPRALCLPVSEMPVFANGENN